VDKEKLRAYTEEEGGGRKGIGLIGKGRRGVGNREHELAKHT